MNPNLPPAAWNLIAVFFLCWFATAGWLLVGNDGSTVVRLAFALCGSLAFFAGSAGGIYRNLGRGFGRLGRRNLGCWIVSLFAVLCFAGVLIPIFLQVQSVATKATMHSRLRREGFSLLQYAEQHGGILPPKTGNMHIYAYIPRAKSPEGDSSSDKPLAWCGELSGLRLEDIAHPEQVVVAYSPRSIGSYYGVLFLNGVSYSREKPE
ncbi:MAG: hypothetical protein H8F28_07980, partial [Fibrella sp.]|nr:hypothetical protein [Armatimonadota bacterium]